MKVFHDDRDTTRRGTTFLEQISPRDRNVFREIIDWLTWFLHDVSFRFRSFRGDSQRRVIGQLRREIHPADCGLTISLARSYRC